MSEFHRTIAAVSPSGIHDPTLLRQSIDLVERWGHTVICSPNHNKRHLYTAGTVNERLADLRWAMTDPAIDTIWFIRGGYGTAQLLPQLPPLCRKDIIGFSDATAILSYGWYEDGSLKRRWPNLFHGPVLNSLATLPDEKSQQHMHTWLKNGNLPALSGEHFLGPSESITGPIVGGNLCVLASLCGGFFKHDFDDCIVALEDIAEPLYKVDRMLYQLEGILGNAKGILLGSFHNCHPPKDAAYTLRDVFRERLEHLNVPVYINSQFGHNEVNWIWKYGQHIQLGD